MNTVVKLKMDMFTEVCKESQVFIKSKRLSENEKAIKFYLREKFSLQSENVDGNTGFLFG